MLPSNILTRKDIIPSDTESFPMLFPLEAADEPVLPCAAADFSDYCGMKNLCSPSLNTPMSLNKIISNGKSLRAVQEALVLDLDQRLHPKSVSFEIDQHDYEYGDASPDSEPRSKRRRYQRRNSKTPAMLMQTQSSFMGFDLFQREEETQGVEDCRNESSVDDWNGGMEIAKELVEQLRNRRQKRMSFK